MSSLVEGLGAKALADIGKTVGEGLVKASERLTEAKAEFDAGNYEKATALAALSRAQVSLSFGVILPPLVSLALEEIAR